MKLIRTCSFCSVSCLSWSERSLWPSEGLGDCDGPLIEARRAVGFREEETRGDTAERAVAPLEIEGAGGDGADVGGTRRVAGRAGAAVVMMEIGKYWVYAQKNGVVNGA